MRYISARETIEKSQSTKLEAEIEQVIARDGSAVARYNQILLNSSYDPLREAKQRAANLDFTGKRLLILFGDGYYYFARHVAQEYGLPVIVLEASPAIAQAAYQAFSPEQFDSFSLFYTNVIQTVSDMLKILPPDVALKDLVLLEHQPSMRLFGEEYQRVQKLLLESFSRQVANLGTVAYFGRQWAHNIISNLRYSASFATVEQVELDGDLVIAVPGPSLESVLPLLLQKRSQFTLLALAPAVRTLLAWGIEPDIVCSMDGGYANSLHLAGIDLPKVPLLFPLYLQPAIVRHWKGPLVAVSFGLGLELQLLEDGTLSLMTESPTVADFALQFALQSNVSTIYVAGQDFAVAGIRQHSRGYRFDQDALDRERRCSGMDMVMSGPYKDHWQQKEGYFSNKKLLMYKAGFLERVATASKPIFQLTENPFMQEIPKKDQFEPQKGLFSLVTSTQEEILRFENIQNLQKELTKAEELLKKGVHTPDIMREIVAMPLLAPLMELVRAVDVFSLQSGKEEKAASLFFEGLQSELRTLKIKLSFLLKQGPFSADN